MLSSFGTSLSESESVYTGTGLVRFSAGETGQASRSTEVPAVWSDGARWKARELAVVKLAVTVLSEALGVPEDADQPRMLRVRMGGGYSRMSSGSAMPAELGIISGAGSKKP